MLQTQNVLICASHKVFLRVSYFPSCRSKSLVNRICDVTVYPNYRGHAGTPLRVALSVRGVTRFCTMRTRRQFILENSYLPFFLGIAHFGISLLERRFPNSAGPSAGILYPFLGMADLRRLNVSEQGKLLVGTSS